MSDKRVFWSNPDGSVSVLVPAPDVEESAWRKDIPADATDVVEIDAAELPDRTFRNAWKREGMRIGHDLSKAKAIAHEKRRVKRASEFAPLDVLATVPSESAKAEAERQKIRDKYALMQTAIDGASSVEQLKSVAASVL